MQSVHELVRKMEDDDVVGKTVVSKYVTVSMREDINTTEAYLNSKHISGDKDYLGRDKPFFNISLAARNIWFRATDIDRKNIRIRAEKMSQQIAAFLATIKLQEWMKKSGFGKVLNDWGLSLASHGSSVLKFIDKGDELACQVIDWNTFLCDPVDFVGNVKIEKLWFTPAQLQAKEEYDQEFVNQLIEHTQVRETMEGNMKDTKSDFILVYEVHGLLPEKFLTDNEEDTEYVQQMHVVAYQQNQKSTYEDYTLFRGREQRDPYFLTHLIKKDGQTYAGGAVKNLFDAQWMVNHSMKLIKDQLELASKIVFQTSDETFIGRNVLSNIENGDILKHRVNEPLTQLNNKPDIAAMQAFKNEWQNISNQINGISEAMLGENAPSGTAWRQVQALLQESHSLFELMTENKGLAIEEMMREFVIPHLKKQLNNSDEISGILEDWQVKQIDAMYVPNEAMRRVNKKKIDTILSGQLYDPMQEGADLQNATQAIQGELTGNQRFVRPADIPETTWKEVFEDLEWQLEVDVTGENKDVQNVLATLTTLLQTLATNPAVLQDPNMKMVFGKILTLAGGVSPLELQATAALPAPIAPPQMATAIQ